MKDEKNEVVKERWTVGQVPKEFEDAVADQEEGVALTVPQALAKILNELEIIKKGVGV